MCFLGSGWGYELYDIINKTTALQHKCNDENIVVQVICYVAGGDDIKDVLLVSFIY